MVPRSFLAGAGLLLLLCTPLSPLLAGVWDVEMPPRDNYTAAKFRLWIPDDLKEVRGVLVLLPGYNGDGRGMATDKNWQAKAEEWKFAIVAGMLQTAPPAQHYAQVELGSGAMFEKALKELGKSSAHPEVGDVPLIMWGHSAGGMFSANFACLEPQRVIAFVAIKGGYYTDKISAAARKVPGLVFAGQKDTDERKNLINALVMDNRKKNAHWCLAMEPNAGHEVGKTTTLAIPFFDTILKERLVAGPGKPTLKDVDEMQSWLGDPETHEIGSASNYTGTKNKAIWLPDEATAKLWQAFVKGEPLAAPAVAVAAPTPVSTPVPTATPATVAAVASTTPAPVIAVPAAPARPKAVHLLVATPFPIVFNGQVAGSVTVPAGSILKVISAANGTLTVEYRNMRNNLAASLTDWPSP